MRLKRFEAARQFRSEAKAYLLEHEVENNLLFGITETLLYRPEQYPVPPYLALVEENDKVVAAALRTPPHNLVLARTSQVAALELIARDLKDTALSGVVGPALEAETFAEAWRSMTGQRYTLTMPQRLYQLSSPAPPTAVPGELRQAVGRDRDLLIAWVQAFHAEALSSGPPQDAARVVDAYLSGPNRALYFWDVGGESVSLAGYSGPTPSGIRVNAVYTPPERRRRGYASACVAALSGRLLEAGYAFCCLYTDLSNPTSNHIYQSIGYEPVCDVNAYRFENA